MRGVYRLMSAANGTIQALNKGPRTACNGRGHGTGEWTPMHDVPYGFCRCGCGEKTRLAPFTDPKRGWVKGQPLAFIVGHARRKPPEDRFWVKVREAENGCWEWTAAREPRYGYGHFDKWLAHRFAYEQVVGVIPEGMQIDHLCRNTGCVNPAHLEAVSPRVNTMRGDTIPTRNAAKTHCVHGHPLEGEHLAYQRDKFGRKHRYCRTCRLSRRRAQRAGR